MEWIDVNNRKPTEDDGLIVVSLKNGFKEIVYIGNEECIKPFRYDRSDTPVATMDSIKYWFNLLDK
jgi:hypothetical protein